jgi:GNAT superfamily N-acetyltransferase
MEIRSITAAEARTVRHPILRPGLPPESTILDHDDDPGTRHLGAYDRGRLVGVATFFAEACPPRPGLRAWRLRGMATVVDMRGRGAGSALVEEGARVAVAHGAALMWCHARVGARGFYEKTGFVAIGDEFELPTSGKHYLMTKDLGQAS